MTLRDISLVYLLIVLASVVMVVTVLVLTFITCSALAGLGWYCS